MISKHGKLEGLPFATSENVDVLEGGQILRGTTRGKDPSSFNRPGKSVCRRLGVRVMNSPLLKTSCLSLNISLC